MESLYQEVGDLIASQKEGEYWDFKEKYNKEGKVIESFIKDIICLANAPYRKGSRYIIVGVKDNGEVCGASKEDEKLFLGDHQVQSKLANAGFANRNAPVVEIHKVQYSEKDLIVIEIKDRPSRRPYSLTEKFDSCSNSVIYSRYGSRNSEASGFDIEKMWRQRFGIDEYPLERMMTYLLDFEGWTERKENEWYYKRFPEFTIVVESEEFQIGDNSQEPIRFSWALTCSDPNSYLSYAHLKYHTTILHTEIVVNYAGFRLKCPKPENFSLNVGSGRSSYYYYICNGLKFNLLQFFHDREYTHDDRVSGGRMKSVGILMFKSENEKINFDQEIKKNPPKDLESLCRSEDAYKGHENQITDAESQEIDLASVLMNKLKEFREPIKT